MTPKRYQLPHPHQDHFVPAVIARYQLPYLLSIPINIICVHIHADEYGLIYVVILHP